MVKVPWSVSSRARLTPPRQLLYQLPFTLWIRQDSSSLEMETHPLLRKTIISPKLLPQLVGLLGDRTKSLTPLCPPWLESGLTKINIQSIYFHYFEKSMASQHLSDTWCGGGLVKGALGEKLFLWLVCGGQRHNLTTELSPVPGFVSKSPTVKL